MASSSRPSTPAGGSGGEDAAPTPASVDAALHGSDGFLVCRQLLSQSLIERALRVLNLAIVRHGLTSSEILSCAQSTFFPHLRWEHDVLALRGPIDRLLVARPDEEWADAQLLLRFPDEAEEWPLTPHVDDLPHWAGNRSYRAIVGIPLSPSSSTNGCLVVWPGSHRGEDRGPTPVELQPGDAVIMDPALQHTGTLNTGGSIRYAVYFRLLTAPSTTT